MAHLSKEFAVLTKRHVAFDITSGGRRKSNLKLGIIKRLKVHGVLSGLFHSGVDYMEMFLEICGKLNFCAVGWF